MFKTNKLVVFLFFFSIISCHHLFCLLLAQPGVFLTAKAKGQLHAQKEGILSCLYICVAGEASLLIRAGEGQRRLDNWMSLAVKALTANAGATVQRH